MEAGHDIVQITTQIVTAAQQPYASPAQLEALGQLFEQVKNGDPRSAVALAAELVTVGRPLEVQHFGFQILQHEVGSRWNDFSEEDRQRLVNLAFDLLQSVGNAASEWALRSKAALLLALATKQSGPACWEALVPRLLKIAQTRPVQAEKVCMVLRLMAEEVTWTGDPASTSQDAKRALLSSLIGTLDPILPFLHTALEQQFGQAMQAAQAGRMDDARMHANVVKAALTALTEYAEWAPLGRLVAAGYMTACGFLVHTSDFRKDAVAALQRVAQRRQLQEDPAVFQEAMAATGEALIKAAEDALSPQNAPQLQHGGQLDEYGQYLVATMGIWGYSHIASLPESSKMHFLQLVLEFTESSYMQLAHKTLPFWVSLLSSAERAQRGSKEQVPLPLACVSSLMDLSGEKMRTGVHLVEETAEVPESFESFEEYRAMLLEYRELLGRIVRLTASLLPQQALEAAARRLRHSLAVCSTSGTSIKDQRLEFEASVYFVENVTHQASQTHLPGGKRQPSLVEPASPDTVNAVLDCLEGMFRELLEVHFRDPALMVHLAKLMEAFSRLIALRPTLAAPAITKVFDMFNDLPMEGGPCHLPSHPPPGWKERFQARNKIPGVLVTYAKAAPEAIRQHLQALAANMDQCWRAQTISPGERAVLCDMMVAAVSTADLQLQQQVMDWVLASTKEEWSNPAWQMHLASTEAMIAFFCPILRREPGSYEVGGGLNRWIASHHLQVVVHAVRRLPASRSLDDPDPGNPQSGSWHMLNQHLDWVLPVLLQFVRGLHSLSTPQGEALLQEAGSALQMGARERAMYLRQKRGKVSGDAAIMEEEEATIAGNNVAALRSWIRQIREATYQALGFLARNVGGFYSCTGLQGHWVAALVGSLDALQSSHLRMLIRHVVIPIVRNCPPEHRRAWLLPVLEPFLPHVLARLQATWAPLLATSGKSGAKLAAATGTATTEDAGAANEEVITERLVRELTTEHLIMLRCMQDPTPPPGLPDAPAGVLSAGNGHAAESKSSQRGLLQWLWSESPQSAVAACMTATAALWWPDEAAGRASMFLRGMLAIAGRQMLEGPAGGKVLRGCIAAISNGVAWQQNEVLGLARDVLIQQPHIPGAYEVLLSLPKANMAVLQDFEQALHSTSSEKEQRTHVKTLLANSGDEELQSALADWRPAGPINMAEPKQRQPRFPAFDEQAGLLELAATSES